MAPSDVWDFAIALFIGALIGIEREKRQATDGDGGLGGIRTFLLLAMTGAVSAWLSVQTGSVWIFTAALALSTSFVVAGYILTVRSGQASPGLTSEIAAVVTVLLGGLVLFGWPELAVGLGITTSAVLAFKGPLHGAVEKLGEDDLYAGLKLLIATFIVLPLLPDRTIDPLGALNPRQLWLLVILIASLSVVGYVAVRLVGQARGTVLTGLLGGMVSSTAVTLSLSRRSREEAGAGVAGALAAGVFVAWVVMFARIVTEVFVVHPSLLGTLVPPLAFMALASGLAGGWMLLRGLGGPTAPAPSEELPLRNPFSLVAAAKFGIFFAAVLLAVALARRFLPPEGLYLVAALAGLTDVDAITLSMAGFARDGGDPEVAVRAITLAALTNTVVKGAMVLVLGSPALRRRILVGLLGIVAAGLAGFLAI